ncbi:MAG: hypothetical protein JST83_11140 [Bacteroidetes bacterium]|nr:hypothetical protein [Bacteroidota bacterium]
MSYYSPSNCDRLPDHTASLCDEVEYGRIRSAGFILLDHTFDPTLTADWQYGVIHKKIIVIPETNGDSPKATPVMAPAYGLRPESLIGYEFTAHYTDPAFLTNCDFYNAAVGNMNYRFFYRTSSHVFITDVPCSITPNRDIKNDLTSEIVWEVDVKWLSKSFACGVPTPAGVFDTDILNHLPPADGGGGGSIPGGGGGGGAPTG